MENEMSCRIDILGGGVVLVSHHPISVFTTTAGHLDRIQRKPDGHYDREDLMALVKEGHAVHYDETVVRAIAQANEFLIHGCPRA
jgi:hypothetical protein